MTDTATGQCIVCKSSDTELVLSTNLITLCNRLYDDPDDAKQAPIAPFELTFCNNCGHGFNSRFMPAYANYDGNYENALHFSPTFRAYAEQQIQSFMNTYDVRGKNILEIGCGQGEWVSALCAEGNNTGFGLDPAFRGEEHVSDRVRIFSEAPKGFFEETPVNVVAARHVLEHFDDPVSWLKQAASWLKNTSDGLLYIEVPSADYMWRECAIWDLIYEHVSYFSAASLDVALRAAGFDVLSLEATFQGQYLVAIAAPAGDRQNPAAPAVGDDWKDFSRVYHDAVDHWTSQLNDIAEKGERAVIWGAGSKGISLAYAVAGNAGEAAKTIDFAVDINPRKRGKYFPTTGLAIQQPDHLRDKRPDHILVMNPIYTEEIAQSVRNLFADEPGPMPSLLPVK